jgi:hypothetical protein
MVVTSVEVAVNRLAPAWGGVELGLEEEIIIKAIAASCGRFIAPVMFLQMITPKNNFQVAQHYK